MKGISIELSNCYGIRSLSHKFDASNGQTFLVYAPNGVMKSSFARVLDDIASGDDPKDLAFPDRVTSYTLRDADGAEIAPEDILVVHPFRQTYKSEKAATLLVNEALRAEYEQKIQDIDNKYNAVIAGLKKSFGTTKDITNEVNAAFPVENNDKFISMEKLHDSIGEGVETDLAAIPYKEIFNDKVVEFLSKSSFVELLQEYVERYEELLDNSQYFKRGVFNHTNADSIHKALNDNGFFKAHHGVFLTGTDDNRLFVNTVDELKEAIEAEKQEILADSELTQRFEQIDSEISKRSELRRFRDFLADNKDLTSRLLDLATLRKDLWSAYGQLNLSLLSDFTETYKAAKARIAELVEAARTQETAWRNIVRLFGERFSVPFDLEVSNRDDVVLKNQAPTLEFTYKDRGDTRKLERDELLSVLSMGERRALHLLNVLFEIESKRVGSDKTVLVIDDIADSFDYQNKYAIVEYLKEIHECEKFCTIVLTHNFDFFRTVQSRLNIGRSKNCLMATRTEGDVKLIKAEYLNPLRHWRDNLGELKYQLASVAMARNLAELTRGEDDHCCDFLNQVLHMKEDTKSLTMAQLSEVLSNVLCRHVEGGERLIYDALMEVADSCPMDTETIYLENKVVMSMAIRLLGEEIMIETIDDPNILEGIQKNQTRELYNRLPDTSRAEGIRRLMEDVVLMTPESIHLNSFMYEPILDMSDRRLKELYTELKRLAA